MSFSRRSILASVWTIVGLLTITSFVIAFIFAYASTKYDDNYGGGGDDAYAQQGVAAISVTSRAMVFAAIWTAVLSAILVIYGTVLLGVQMPTGKYYACCSGNVHRMTPLSLGAFGGSLVMFANLTLVCAILFGEFEIREFSFDAAKYQNNNEGNQNDRTVRQTSFAFSVLCIFFTVMYSSFAALVFVFSNSLLEESVADARRSSSSKNQSEFNNAPGYIGGDRFGVGRTYGKNATNIDVL
ncbi:hypothetical protein ACHAXS_001043 [Conticribra weissflogii]